MIQKTRLLIISTQQVLADDRSIHSQNSVTIFQNKIIGQSEQIFAKVPTFNWKFVNFQRDRFDDSGHCPYLGSPGISTKCVESCVDSEIGNVMFHGPLVVLCITHAFIVSIVCIHSVEGGANGSQNKIQLSGCSRSVTIKEWIH